MKAKPEARKRQSPLDRQVFVRDNVVPHLQDSKQVAVLWALVHRLEHETQTCFPSVAQIMRDTKFSKASVERALSELEGLRIFTAQRRKHQSKVYKLTVQKFKMPHTDTSHSEALSSTRLKVGQRTSKTPQSEGSTNGGKGSSRKTPKAGKVKTPHSEALRAQLRIWHEEQSR